MVMETETEMGNGRARGSLEEDRYGDVRAPGSSSKEKDRRLTTLLPGLHYEVIRTVKNEQKKNGFLISLYIFLRRSFLGGGCFLRLFFRAVFLCFLLAGFFFFFFFQLF